MPINKRSILLPAILIVLGVFLSSCNPGPPPCSQEWLVNAINNANSNGPGTDIINLDGSCVYQLATIDNTVDGNNGLPSITSSIVINGNGATVRRSTGAQKMPIRLFHVSQGGELVIDNLTLHDGIGMEPPDITIPLRNSGGAIFNAGTLTVTSSVFDYNRATQNGGAVYNSGTMTVENTTFQNNAVNINNETWEKGGAIYNVGTATITTSTISNNIASWSGGGIVNAGTITITNSTISGNSTTLSGGAAIMNTGSLTMNYTTIAENVSASIGAIFSTTDTIEIDNTIVADNPGGNCSYPPTSMILGMNIDSDGTCLGMLQRDAQLGPLANNGGPTLTHSIAPTSPARDEAFGLCPATDQRGEPRPHGSACDLGSYEFNGGALQATAELSGMVYNDVDGDGVWTPGEPPFEGVELVYGEGSCATASASQTTLSASDGSYHFNLPSPNAGTHCISIDPLVEPNTSILIPGGFTDPASGEREITITEGQILSDLDFGWMFQFGANPGPANLAITNVTLSDTTISPNDWVGVEVTVENTGSAPASGYDVVLIPHYGDGPPNPAGLDAIPELAPGASYTAVFSPGVLYTNLGTHTLRVLVTDDWYELGDPDSTGTAGDLSDHGITVQLQFCNPFLGKEIKIVLLSIPPETRNLPLYIKVPDGMIPGADEDGQNLNPEYEYRANLGDIASYKCGLQGFPDRLYCMFNIPEGKEATAQPFQLWLSDCPEPVYELPAVQIPEIEPEGPVCNADLNEKKCTAAGGTYYRLNDKTSTCICP